MHAEIRRDGAVAIIELEGDIDSKTAPAFQEQVRALVQPQTRLVINLDRVAFMSSAGLRALLLIYREAKARAAKVVLTGVNQDIRNTMSATGFLSFFVVCASVQEGIEAAG
jgi:anti-sigma B factor antagonist